MTGWRLAGASVRATAWTRDILFFLDYFLVFVFVFTAAIWCGVGGIACTYVRTW